MPATSATLVTSASQLCELRQTAFFHHILFSRKDARHARPRQATSVNPEVVEPSLRYACIMMMVVVTVLGGKVAFFSLRGWPPPRQSGSSSRYRASAEA